MYRVILFLLTACLSSLSSADWELDKSASTFTFSSTKNLSITETHRFKELNGSVSNAGEVKLEINLFSVDTSIKIRDQRMHDILFAIAPEAIFKAQIDLENLVSMKAGSSVAHNVEGNLRLHGFEEPLMIEATIMRLDSGRIQVEGAGQIDVETFGYAKGIEELRTIAGLEAISTKVDFDLKLTFREIEDN